MVDTSILIEYFRKTDKNKSALVNHFTKYDMLYISSVTEFEIINGANEGQIHFWEQMLTNFIVLDFDSRVARQASKIVSQLKQKRKTMDVPDLFIAATAVRHGITLDTANKKHFIHVEDLILL